MKLLRTLFVTLIVLLVVLLAASFFLPKTFSVQRTAVITGAAPEMVYSRFITPRTWAEWSAWTTEADSTLVYSYAGPDSGVGAIMRWTAKKMGNGELEIMTAEPPREVTYELRMQGSDMKVMGHVTLEPAADGTRLTWRDSGDFGSNPVYRWFGFIMDQEMGKAYQKSFDRLQREATGR